MSKMSSSRPYLVKALYDWIVDNNCTPYILVSAEIDGVSVPRQFVKDGQIILNISPAAVVGLNLDNDAISFSARFAGSPMDVFVPNAAVLGIYAQENGQGMIFEPEDDPDPAPQNPDKSSKPSLKVVK